MARFATAAAVAAAVAVLCTAPADAAAFGQAVLARQVKALTKTLPEAIADPWSKVSHPAYPSYKVRVLEPEGYCDPAVEQKSGYFDIDGRKHFYFHFFESRSDPETDPFVLWLNGGPGCSSMTGLYMENGPCRVREDGSALDYNEYGWNANANIIFLDQPLGAGFSFGSGGAWDTDEAAKDVYAFFQVFFREYPKYAKASFHIWGESYAGHYIPAFGDYFNKQNKVAHEKGFIKINFQSVGIGNGATDPAIQFGYSGPMACGEGGVPAVLPQETCDAMREAYPTCRALVDVCYVKPHNYLACSPARIYCHKMLSDPYTDTGRNVYDMRVMGEYKILEGMQTWLSKDEVKSIIGTEGHDFGGCSPEVSRKFHFHGDNETPYTESVVNMLADGTSVLIYAGDQDWICNWMGNKVWLMQMQWPGQMDFLATTEETWYVDGEAAGQVRTSGNLTFLRVFNAGHMVPYDQPKRSLDMLNRRNAGLSFTDSSFRKYLKSISKQLGR